MLIFTENELMPILTADKTLPHTVTARQPYLLVSPPTSGPNTRAHQFIIQHYINNHNNNNNNHDDIYSAVIMAEPLREFTRLNTETAPGGRRPLGPSQSA